MMALFQEFQSPYGEMGNTTRKSVDNYRYQMVVSVPLRGNG
ncbi:hypothetical protein HMPREF3201_01614 [Megasphaera sp. MJR8396C]|nr:hypothetical protein HMPREF3201_01614 [Megasphaera sp. MJR8396C]